MPAQVSTGKVVGDPRGGWTRYLPPTEPQAGGALGRKLEPWFRFLQLVRKRTLVTVAEAARITRRTEDTINRSWVNELTSIGLLELDPGEDLPEPRPELHYRLTATAAWSIGVAFERDRVVALPFDLSYRTPSLDVAAERPVAVDDDPDGALEAAAHAVASIIRDAPCSGDLLGIGVAIPAPVDVRGVCRTHIAGHWYGRQPAAEISARVQRLLPADATPLKVVADNDASLGSLGLFLRRFQRHPIPAQVPRDLLYVRVADGVGAGLVSKGKYVRGGHGLAGELGHRPVAAEGARVCDRCGRRCLETLASTAAIERRVRRIFGERSIRDLIDDYDALERGKQSVLNRAVYQAGQHLGTALADVSAWADPFLFVLGGPLARSEQLAHWLREGVDNTIRQRGLPFYEADELCRPIIEVIRPEAAIPLPELRGAAGVVIQEHADAWIWWRLEQEVEPAAPFPSARGVG